MSLFATLAVDMSTLRILPGRPFSSIVTVDILAGWMG